MHRDQLSGLTELLEAIVEDRGILSCLDESERQRFLMAAGRVSRPDRAEQRKLRKALAKHERDERKRADAELLDSTGIRSLRREPVFRTPAAALGGSSVPPPPLLPAEAGPTELHDEQKCYVCKSGFRQVHAFYDQMCPECAELNWIKRNQTSDLTGRVALVTGARVKIGYQTAIKLLRAGCHVIVTTRFPVDAAARYAREEDFASFAGRLEIHGLDLRHTPSVESLCADLVARLPRLDFLINNACQTVRRPPGFYRHLLQGEEDGARSLPAAAQAVLEHHEALVRSRREALVSAAGASTARMNPTADIGRSAAPQLSQLALVDGDAGLHPNNGPDRNQAPDHQAPDLRLFPSGELDQDLQQRDLRSLNSWRLRLHEVPTIELLEVHLVNAVGPYVLNARLRPLMQRVPTRDKHIVNVSAMEGQFYREWKTDKHPHTNMAKAALNMMTRTSAIDYLADGIHMNSVDTGWVTDEDPAEIAAKKVEEHGFHPPLDIVDGAARILAPIFDGFQTGEHVWGLFLKDYRPIPW